MGIYYIYLQDWFRQFPRQQILILRLKDLSSEPGSTLKSVFQFLGVSSTSWKMPTKEEGRNANRNPINIGPMHDKTKLLLKKFYAEFNEHLVTLLGDTKYLWS